MEIRLDDKEKVDAVLNTYGVEATTLGKTNAEKNEFNYTYIVLPY